MIADNNWPLKTCNTFPCSATESREEYASDEKDEADKNVLSSGIKDILSTWSKVPEFVEKSQPDKAFVSHVCNLLSDNVVYHFRHTFKWQYKHTILVSFFEWHWSSDSEADPSAKTSKGKVKLDIVAWYYITKTLYLIPSACRTSSKLILHKTCFKLLISECLERINWIYIDSCVSK